MMNTINSATGCHRQIPRKTMTRRQPLRLHRRVQSCPLPVRIFLLGPSNSPPFSFLAIGHSASAHASRSTLILSAVYLLASHSQTYRFGIYQSFQWQESSRLNRLPLLRLSTGRRPLDPLPWNDYFTRELYLRISRSTETVTYHAYMIPPAPKGPLLVTHHGAGSSGLSYALFASEICKALPNAGVLSLDARGHGETVVEQLDSRNHSAPLNLDLETLSQDFIDVIRMSQTQMAWPALPDLLFIGHSLGGAVVTNVAVSGKLGNAVLGYAVLDVVEGMTS